MICNLILIFSICLFNNSNAFKITYISTINKCGIATYTRHLVNELNRLGESAKIINSLQSANSIINELEKEIPDIINLQFSAGTVNLDFLKVADWAKLNDVKFIVTVHENFFWLPDLILKADKVILHKDDIKSDSLKYISIPMAVPNFELKYTKSELRKKYSYNNNDIIISTFGFMIGWKNHAKIVYKLTPYLNKNKNIKLQLLTSYSTRIDLRNEDKKIKKAIKDSNVSNQIVHITDFLPDKEICERLYISDLGFLWGEKDYAIKVLGSTPNTTSASDKQFVSARLPLVIVDCAHYHNCNTGVVKTNQNIRQFIDTIIKTVEDKQKLEKLRKEMDDKYQKNCSSTIINKHLEVFYSLLKS